MSENSDIGALLVLWLGKKHTSGAEGPFFALVWVPGLKPRPTSEAKDKSEIQGFFASLRMTTYNVQRAKAKAKAKATATATATAMLMGVVHGVVELLEEGVVFFYAVVFGEA